MAQRRFLVGTYTTERTIERASRGLYLCAMDSAGRIDIVDVCDMPDPSFVVLHPALPLAYVVNETPTGHGGVSAVAIGDRLEPQQRVDSEGELPCHLALLGARALVVAHYGCGTIGVFELDAHGAIAATPRTRRHAGASVHPRRQGSAHPHCVIVGASGDFHVTDLGQDCVVRYAGTGLEDVSRCAIHAGAGPRHLCLDETNGFGWLATSSTTRCRGSAIGSDGSLRELRLGEYVAGRLHRPKRRQRDRRTPERTLAVRWQPRPRFDRELFDRRTRAAHIRPHRAYARSSSAAFRTDVGRCRDARRQSRLRQPGAVSDRCERPTGAVGGAVHWRSGAGVHPLAIARSSRAFGDRAAALRPKRCASRDTALRIPR